MTAQSGGLQAVHSDVADDWAARSKRRPVAVAHCRFVAAWAAAAALLLLDDGEPKRERRSRLERHVRPVRVAEQLAERAWVVDDPA